MASAGGGAGTFAGAAGAFASTDAGGAGGFAVGGLLRRQADTDSSGMHSPRYSVHLFSHGCMPVNLTRPAMAVGIYDASGMTSQPDDMTVLSLALSFEEVRAFILGLTQPNPPLSATTADILY